MGRHYISNDHIEFKFFGEKDCRIMMYTSQDGSMMDANGIKLDLADMQAIRDVMNHYLDSWIDGNKEEDE